MRTYGFWFYNELRHMIGYERRGMYVFQTPNNGPFRVRTNSSRLECLKRNPTCVQCGVEGIFWMLQSQEQVGAPADRAHLNLYAYVQLPYRRPGAPSALYKNGLILMTRDHIVPRSHGGDSSQQNLQTMCTVCNHMKADTMPPYGLEYMT